jgi:hypothetical protein
MRDSIGPDEREIVERQLGRPPRALVGVAHRCPCGQPDVVETSPRLEDGTPFPTPGVNPIGDRAVAEMGEWWADGPCAQPRDEP